MLEASESEKKIADPSGLVRALGAHEKLMGTLSDVGDVCSKHSESGWGRNLSAWTRAEHARAASRRNDLLVRLAAVRAAVDDNGPAPMDEPACTQMPSTVEEKQAFVAASQELVIFI